MTVRKCALILAIGLFPCSNAALATVDSKAVSDAPMYSEQSPITGSSVAIGDSTVTVDGESWRVRRAKNPMGSIVLVRNETAMPLAVSLGGESTQVPPNGVSEQRCEVGRQSYPLAIASDQGERVLDAQLTCGDSVVVQSRNRPEVPSLEAVNEAWALPPGESAETPVEGAGEH